MVENPGETLHTGAYKPVNPPEPVGVEEDATGFPVAVRLYRRQAIAAVEDHWRIDDEWWRSEPVSRIYFEVQLVLGRWLVLYKDLFTGNWYRQSY